MITLRGKVTLQDVGDVEDVLNALDEYLKKTANQWWTPERGKLLEAFTKLKSRRAEHEQKAANKPRPRSRSGSKRRTTPPQAGE